MAIYEFEGKRPSIGAGSFVPETADVIGDVTIGEKCFIGVGARIRGDYGSIVIGNRTSVQENVVIHARDGDRSVVGDNVQLGHGCILHNCTVKDNAVIGVGAIISDYAVVGDWAIIGEGAVVRGISRWCHRRRRTGKDNRSGLRRAEEGMALLQGQIRRTCKRALPEGFKRIE
jgi:carbonic anhydrase/acetyltransferase-like protein (isoleucine patch superfamily)